MRSTIINVYKNSKKSLFFGFIDRFPDSLVSIDILNYDNFNIFKIFKDNSYLCTLMDKKIMCLTLSSSPSELIRLMESFKSGKINFEFTYYEYWKEGDPILLVFSNQDVSVFSLELILDDRIYKQLSFEINE